MIYRELLETVREYRPCCRTIVYHYGEQYPYYLRFPTLLFVNVLGAASDPLLLLGFTPKPIESLQDGIWVAPLSNVYRGGRVCGPRSRNMNDAIRYFWGSSFTNDGDLGPHKLIRAFCTPEEASTGTQWGNDYISNATLKPRMIMAYSRWAEASVDPNFSIIDKLGEPDYTVEKFLHNYRHKLELNFDAKYEDHPAEIKPPSGNTAGCPRCGFTYGWGGSVCSHCGFVV